MFDFLKKLLLDPDEMAQPKNLPDNDAVETKKCAKCLKRVRVHFIRCPYCGSMDFFDE